MASDEPRPAASTGSSEDPILAARNADEFTRFAHEHTARLLRIAEAALCDRGRAEDVVQETLIRIWERWSHARVGGLSYVKAALSNMIIDEFRKAARRPHEVMWTHDDAFPIQPDDELAEVDAALRLMSTIPVQQRLVLALREIDGRTTKQTAQILGVSTGTVKSQHSRAKAALTKYLKTSDEDQVRELMTRVGPRS